MSATNLTTSQNPPRLVGELLRRNRHLHDLLAAALETITAQSVALDTARQRNDQRTDAAQVSRPPHVGGDGGTR